MLKNKYKEMLNSLMSAKSTYEINNLFSVYNIKRKNRVKYPSLNISISRDEIIKLKHAGIINSENEISLSSNTNLSTLEKILYGMIWKNGDLGKEKHIISGILGLESGRGIVFNQFGKYLNDKKENIIDQNVLRVFILYQTGDLIENIKMTHYNMFLDKYNRWFNENELFVENKELVDEFLFMIGKSMKEQAKKE